MHFLAPSLLLGLLAAALPAIIHRIGRRHARPVRFAAMELLLRAEHEVSARRRLRDALLLFARTGLAMALPLAFARPFAEVRSDLPAVTGRSQSAVVVLDDSASMRRRAAEGGTPFDAARAKARAVIEHLSADSEVALVLASEGSAAPIAELASDRARVVAALEAVPSSARRADFAAALRRATQILAGSTRADRLIYVATDLQAAGWDDVKPAAGAGAPQIVLLDASGGAAWTNRAVRRARRRAGARGGGPGDRGDRRDRQLLPRAGAEPGRDAGARRRRGGAWLRRRPRGRSRPQAVRPDHRRRQRARGRGGDRQGRLPARRSARLPGRGLARPAGADRRRRSAHGPDRGRDVLPRGGAAGGRQRLLGHEHAPRRSRRPRSLRLRRHLRGQREPPGADGRRGADPLRRGGRGPLHLGRRSRRHRRLEPGRQGDPAAAARPQAERRRAAGRARRGGDGRPPPGRAPGADRSPPPAPLGVPGPRRRAVVGAVLPVHAPLAAAGRARTADRAPLRERRAGAGRGGGRPRPRPAAHHHGRPRVDRPADPPGVSAADSGDRPLPGGRPVRRGGDRHRRRTEAGDRARARRSPGGDRAARRRVALADAAGAQRRRARPPHPHLRGDRRARLLSRARRARRRHHQRASGRRLRRQPRPARVGSGASPRRQAPRSRARRPRRPAWRRAAGSSCGTRSAPPPSRSCCSSRC